MYKLEKQSNLCIITSAVRNSNKNHLLGTFYLYFTNSNKLSFNIFDRLI